MSNDLATQLEEAWPSPVVFRRDVETASAGAISRKYLANLDSKGQGPEGKSLINGKAAYPKTNFFNWLRLRIK